MKKYITGGLTEREARKFLFSRGVKAFMALGGQNAKIGAEFDDLPLFWFDRVEFWSAWNRMTYHAPRRYVGQMVGISIRFDMLVCWDCAHSLRDYITQFSPTLELYTKTEQGYCEVCGKWENDDIPF